MSAPWRTEEININLGTTQQLSTPFSQLIKEITNVTYRKTRWFRWFWQKFGIKGTEALTMDNSKRQLSSKTPILLTKSKIMRTKICGQIARFQEPLRFKYWPIVWGKKKWHLTQYLDEGAYSGAQLYMEFGGRAEPKNPFVGFGFY